MSHVRTGTHRENPELRSTEGEEELLRWKLNPQYTTTDVRSSKIISRYTEGGISDNKVQSPITKIAKITL